MGLHKANLREADFLEVNVIGSDLREADLSDAKLEGAIYNAQNLWPEGFDPKVAGFMLKDSH